MSTPRASGLRSWRAFWYVVPLAVATFAGLVFGRSLLGSASNTALASPAAPVAAPSTATSAAATVATTAAVSSMPSLGTKKGTITLAGPAKVAKGSAVIFVLDGPKRLLKTDAKKPFAVKVKTSTLPNGKYTLTTLVLRTGTSSVATTSSLQIKNAKAKAAKKSAKQPAAKATTKPSTGKSGSGGTSKTPATASGFAAEVLRLANVQRAKAGCEPLALNSKLNKAAQAHSTDMATANFFSHDSQDGRTPFDRIKAAGYSFGAAAENIAAGSTTAAGAMDQWMNSAGHKANILNCTYVDLGVGYAPGENAEYAGYWTQDFGKPL
ncbi:MAG TPA: CAP domain-containing protein [Kineosporiaceae bacterium]|nr:CAP domain-containing protein [Kineosporiaceae bacterium]